MVLHTLGFAKKACLFIESVQQVKPITEQRSFLKTKIVEEQLYMIIPESVLEQPLLFVRYDYVVRRRFLQVVWSLEGNNILLKAQSIQSSAGIILPIHSKLPLKDNIIAVFPLDKSKDSNGNYTINITELILRNNIEWEPSFTESIVPQITLLIDAKNLEDEVIIKTRTGLVKGKSKVAIPIFYGFCALPEPMKPRRFDYRMGFYDEEMTGIHFMQRNSLANISRWRLDKKFKNQKTSVPVKPITFLISPEVPNKWRPYIRSGIEEWLPAFESAGFKDALVVKELDSLDEWQAHSIHSNVIFWSQNKYFRGSEYEDYGATIAHIIDRRSGEILRGDIFMGASARTVAEKYFIRASPLDKRAQKFPFPDDLIGELFQVIAAHEAGHVFGLMDANYGEYTYPWDKMNDSLWLRTMGHTPSIMNYTRTNNIPQPEDSIPPHLLLQNVGPTDVYNIKWAYTEFDDDISPFQEAAALEQMIRWQDSVPWYRFNINKFEIMGPAASNEVVETNAPIQSTKLALKNVKRVIDLLPKATIDQNDNAQLERLYEKTLELWHNHMQHVVTLIGGYDIHYKSINQPGNLYTPIAWETQKEALKFLLDHAFDAPDWLTKPSFHARTKYSTFPDKVLVYQQRLIMELIAAPRLKRLEQLESTPGNEGLIQAYLALLQYGLFKELKEESAHTDRRRQEIQMTYIDQLIKILDQERIIIDPQKRFFSFSDYSKGLIMQQLMSLKKEIKKKLKGNKEPNNLGNWELCLRKINNYKIP